MTLELKILSFKKAVKEKRSKEIVEYKFREYMKAYDNQEHDLIDKQTHRDLALEYFRYVFKSGK
jgi:hypothetical protein